MKTRTLALAAAATMLVAAPAQAQDDRTITIVVPDSARALDPCSMSQSYISRILQQNVVETLTELDPTNGDLTPRLATAWEQTAPDRWRFTLREGVKFHDGTDFNAQSVAHSIARTLNPDLECSTRQKYFGGIQITPEIVDDYTIDLVTTPNVPILGVLMSTMGMLSVNAPVDGPDSTAAGTGPYVLGEVDIGNRTVIDRFDGYWGEQPAIERGIYVNRSESAVAAAMVATGEADLAPYIAVQDATNPETDFSYPNTETAHVVVTMNVPPLDDVRIRQALNYGVDRDAFIGTILAGGTLPASQLVLPFISGYNPDIAPWPYDPDKARALVAEAAADGVDTSTQLTIFSRSGYMQNSDDVTAVLADMWTGIGLNVTTQVQEAQQFAEQLRRPHPAAGERPAGLLLNLHDNASGDAGGMLFNKYSGQGVQSESEDPELDRLITEGLAASGDERRALFQQAFSYMRDVLVPDVLLFHLVGHARVAPHLDWRPSELTNTQVELADIRFK